jgi:hypothetical protein
MFPENPYIPRRRDGVFGGTGCRVFIGQAHRVAIRAAQLGQQLVQVRCVVSRASQRVRLAEYLLQQCGQGLLIIGPQARGPVVGQQDPQGPVRRPRRPIRPGTFGKPAPLAASKRWLPARI